MNLVDSTAWVGCFKNGPNARFFMVPIQDTENLLVPTICLHEVFQKTCAHFGQETALQAMAVMTLGQVVELDRDLAVDAALVSPEMKLTMADSIILATVPMKPRSGLRRSISRTSVG
jgi:hypothetical protein